MADTMFICHSDFEKLEPINVFHKELDGKQIEAEAECLKNRHILFRKEFCLESLPEDAVIRITADDYFKLYVNGKFVTMGPAAAYPQDYNYIEIGVGEYLKTGRNILAVHTYYQGYRNRVWVSGDDREMLWCEILAGGKKIVKTDTTWKCSEHSGYRSLGVVGYETQVLEEYDSNAPECDFYKIDFDDSSWDFAKEKQHTDYNLVKQTTKPLTVYDVKAIKAERTGDTLRLDFGREMVGYIIATAKGPKGSVVTIRCGEELNDDGLVRFNMRCGMKYEEKWILSGKTDELMQYDYKAFRYAELAIPDGAEIISCGMKVRHYPFAEKAAYKTDNPVLRDIIRLSVDTAKYATQENYVDCPTREKGQYLGDVSIAGRAQAIASGDLTMIKKAINDFCVSSFLCPGIMTISNGSLMQEIADYSLQFPAQVMWVVKTEGDISFLRKCEPYMTGCFEYFKKYMNSDYLIENVTDKWNLVDWPGNLRDGYNFQLTKPIGPGAHNVVNAFWIGFLEAMDDCYKTLGKPLTGITLKAKKSFIKTFYNEETGLFCDSAEKTHSAVHSNVLPLLFDIGTKRDETAIEDYEERCVKFIMEKKLSAMGVYMAYFTLAGLVTHGYRKEAEILATDEGAWPLMLKEGATTTFEAWGKAQKWNTSLCHPWASAPAIVFAENAVIY